MVARKKKPVQTGDHQTSVVEYKSPTSNFTLHQPVCSCGWDGLRYFQPRQAVVAANSHKAEA